MHSKEQLFEILVNDYSKYFYNFSLSRTASIINAEDLSQRILMECVDSINRNVDIKDINKYFWSIAHNTYKRYLKEINNSIVYDNEFCMRIEDSNNVDTSKENEYAKIRYCLLTLSGLYRKIIVEYYYDGLKIKEIAFKNNLSIEMVKWYLHKGKIKLKEIYQMETNYGQKSFKPIDLSVYYSGIDFSRVNVWQLFKRLLPKQIAVSCKQKAKSITDLSIELGVASCYLEEEINILIDGGVIINNGKEHFQTNFLIINNKDHEEIKNEYDDLYKNYITNVEKIFKENLDNIKKTNMFKYDVEENRYRWIFGDCVADFDSRILCISDNEYPRILSCGARAFIFGEEEKELKYSVGQTPTAIDEYKLWARDSVVLGKCCKNQLIERITKLDGLKLKSFLISFANMIDDKGISEAVNNVGTLLE